MGWYYIPLNKMTGCWDGSLGFSSPYRGRGFLSSQQRPGWVCMLPIISVSDGDDCFAGGQIEYSVKLTTFPPSFEIMKAWSCTSIPSPVFMV